MKDKFKIKDHNGHKAVEMKIGPDGVRDWTTVAWLPKDLSDEDTAKYAEVAADAYERGMVAGQIVATSKMRAILGVPLDGDRPWSDL